MSAHRLAYLPRAGVAHDRALSAGCREGVLVWHQPLVSRWALHLGTIPPRPIMQQPACACLSKPEGCAGRRRLAAVDHACPPPAASLEVGHARHPPVCRFSVMSTDLRSAIGRQAYRERRSDRAPSVWLAAGAALTGGGCRRGGHRLDLKLRPRSGGYWEKWCVPLGPPAGSGERGKLSLQPIW